MARERGATHSIENRDGDVARRITAITGGGVDHVVETTGEAALTDLALDLLKPGGRLALLTGGRGAASGRSVLSVIQGDVVPQRFMPYLIRLYQGGRFPFDRLVRFYPFSEINRAIAAARRGDTIKPALRISDPD